jgi:integrase
MTVLENAVASSRRLADTTRNHYLKRVTRFVEFAGRDPHGWTVASLEKWRDALLDDGLTPQTVNLYMAAVSFASKRMERRAEGVDFARGAERVQVSATKPSPKALTIAQCKRLLGTCQPLNVPVNLRDRAMILVSLQCAFRRQELCLITFDNIVAQHVTVIAKGRRLHTVKVGHEAWMALQLWMAWLHGQDITTGPVFRSLRTTLEPDVWNIGSKCMTPDGFAKNLRARGQSVGLDIHPHTLRHTYTSLALKSGVAPYRIKKVLGHKTDLMMERYAHDLTEAATGDEMPPLED